MALSSFSTLNQKGNNYQIKQSHNNNNNDVNDTNNGLKNEREGEEVQDDLSGIICEGHDDEEVDGMVQSTSEHTYTMMLSNFSDSFEEKMSVEQRMKKRFSSNHNNNNASKAKTLPLNNKKIPVVIDDKLLKKDGKNDPNKSDSNQSRNIHNNSSNNREKRGSFTTDDISMQANRWDYWRGEAFRTYSL